MRFSCLGVLCWLLGFGAGCLHASAAERPDILFIAIDDLNDWVGFLGGHPQTTTPHLDRLATQGMVFAQAQCAAPACCPSRAAVMGGLRPYTTGLYLNEQPYGPTLRGVLTLNRYLRQEGYRVVGGGKIYHGYGGLPGEKQTDWDEYFDRGSDPHPPVKSLNGLNAGHFDWGPLEVADEAMGDYRLATWAATELLRPHDQPLFLAVGFVKPHLPWYVPRPYFDRFPLEHIRLPEVKDDDLADLPPAGVRMARPEGDHAAVVAAGQWPAAVQAYLATIAFVDAQVGRLLEAVEKLPAERRPIIVLWSDHGWHLGEKQHWRKFALWEDATRAPFLVVAPGLATPGSRCETPVDFMSIYPTVADLAGLPLPAHLEGASLRPLLANPAAAWPHPSICTHGRGNHAVRDRDWRYIRYADESEELYDHRTDPNEWYNLASDPTLEPVRARLRALLPVQEAAPAD